MEFAASILTAIDFAFKTSKLLHSLISGVKDGPSNVRLTADAITSLVSTLEQLSKCRALDAPGGDALKAKILACVDDLEAFGARIKELVIGEEERRLGQYWKRLKSVYNEKGLDRMRGVVEGHTAALSLHLATLQSEAVFGIPDQLSSIDRRLAPQETMPGQLGVIRQQLVQQRSESQSQRAFLADQRVTLGQVSRGVSSLQGEIESATQQVLAAQTAHGTETNQKLDMILEQMLKLTVERQHPARVVEVPDNSRPFSEPSGLGPCSEFMDSISRLCRLVDAHQEKKMLRNSTDVIKSLLELLSYMISGDFLQSAVAANLVGGEPCGRCSGRHVDSLKATLSSVYGILLSSPRTTLNHHGKAKRVRSVTLTRVDSNATAYSLDIGTLLVCSSTQYVCVPDEDGRSQHWTPSGSEVTTRISFIPSHHQPLRQMVRLTTRQSFKDDGVFSSIPVLEVNRVIPAGSPVFTIVRQGRFDEFMALLRDGKASVRDHDEYGASLLHYANVQPRMCRYLINSGLDVNSLGRITALQLWFGEGTPEIATPLYHDQDLGTLNTTLRHRRIACRQYLLEAGADTNWVVRRDGTKNEYDNFVFSTFHSNCLEFMKQVLDEFGWEGCQMELSISPLLLVCHSTLMSPDAIRLLLRRGASVHDRDTNGDTCLHIFLDMPERYFVYHGSSSIRDTVIHLIRQGAVVDAKNHYGESVSDFAYRRTKKETIVENKLREELWDSSLASCGYNLTEFKRRRRPKVFSYPCPFTSQHFKGLWAGCEHLRPDYDDEKSAIYFSDSDAADEDDNESSQWDESEETYDLPPDILIRHEDSEREEKESPDWGDSEQSDDSLVFESVLHSTLCCPRFLRS